MNKIKSLTFTIAFFTLISCKKQLNTVPTDFVSSANYYTGLAQFQQGLTGVYDVLGDPAMYQEALLSYMSYTNDEAIFVFTQQAFIQPSNFSYSPSDPNISNLWNALYRGINNANILLEALDSPNAANIAQTDRDRIRGQLLFLRAYYFFMLADRWGPVPMPLSSTKTAADVDMARSPLPTIYNQIISDMTTAEALLPSASTLGVNSSGTLSKNAAEGILARVCLTAAGYPLNDQSKYSDALKWCNKLMATGGNALDPSYADLFVKEARNEYYTPENIWEVEFLGNLTDNYREQGYVGIRNGVYAPNGIVFPGYGYNFLGASIALYNKYQSDPVTTLSSDLRRDRNISTYQWTGGTANNQNMTKSYFAPGTNLYSRWPAKWRRDDETTLPRAKNGNGTNFPLLRYSDVLLMFAEAENAVNGPDAAAYQAINQVRERAYGTGYRVNKITITNGGSGYTSAPLVTIDNSGDPNGASTACAYSTISGGKVTAITLVSMGAFYSASPPNVTITSADGAGSGATALASVQAIVPAQADLAPGLNQTQFLQAIMDERPKELAYECLRTHDLVRWNILIPTMQNLAATYGSAAPAGTIRTAYTSPAANITSRHLLYPIPPSEIATNALITQNPGW